MIIIEGVFEGNLDQFRNCFFNVTDRSVRDALAEIEAWCEDYGYNMRIEGDISANESTNNGR